ncbi:hypothetical protein B0O99DRAFT_525779 [Bisporella sp. PMI_857]|nr:hypothetical protein B0O99DRAFT_525779 [Bisporella sp. PMI_857]
MAIKISCTTLPLRQNKWRQRPGSRARRRIPSKNQTLEACNESSSDSHDVNPLLPFSEASPRLCCVKDFYQYWQRWKSRPMEEEAQTEMNNLLLEQEQQKLFGGDGDDDWRLCLAMLDVVICLFGDTDYLDP